MLLDTHRRPRPCGGNLDLRLAETRPCIVEPGEDADRIPGIVWGWTSSSSWKSTAAGVKVLEVPAAHAEGAITK